MTTVHLTENAYLQTGSYRIPTSEGGASIYELNGSWYQASAEDNDGNEYTVYWNILDDYDESDGDESNACDWENPAYITGERNGHTCEVSENVTLD